MKIADLTEENLKTIARRRPGWLARHNPEWLAEHDPELLAKHNPEWLARHDPEWDYVPEDISAMLNDCRDNDEIEHRDGASSDT